MVSFIHFFFYLFMVLLCLFLILVVLIQRGKGGGLVGAFGGAGGNSPFGGRPTDVFVKITIVTVIIWFVSCLGGRYIIDMRSDQKDFMEGTRTAKQSIDTPALSAPEERMAPQEGGAPPEGVPATEGTPAPVGDTPPATEPVPTEDAK